MNYDIGFKIYLGIGITLLIILLTGLITFLFLRKKYGLKYLKNALICLVVLLFAAYVVLPVSSIFFDGASFIGMIVSNKKTAEKYADYKCYDYHFKTKSVTGQEIKGQVYNKDGSGIASLFSKITNESDSQFVVARQFPFLIKYDFSSTRVLQNPDDYIDILNDWTVKKICIVQKTNGDKIYIDQETTIAETDSEAVLGEAVRFITTDVGLKKMYPIIEAKEKGLVYNTESLQLDIIFNESENVIWESLIEYYCDTDGNIECIIIEKGAEPNEFIYAKPSGTKYMIFQSDEEFYNLFEFIDNAIGLVRN